MAETILVKLIEGDLSERVKSGNVSPLDLTTLDEMDYISFFPIDESGQQTRIINETEISLKIRNYNSKISAFFLKNMKSTDTISFAIIYNPEFNSSSKFVSFLNAIQFTGSVYSFKIIADNSQQTNDGKNATLGGQRTLCVSLKIKELTYLGNMTSTTKNGFLQNSIDKSVIVNS